ncbi:ribose ABC transporter ribose-binding protein [Planococcus antarcticus DSM 14505]|uniref:Ribose ABC transporter ribose-binding protein n=1 Tax=Planococcus antarcticus DSM 14505 TaxID=1185653 RepID=A0AA87LUN0_9BACL|nr:ribose ABC transporter ribose-binding protein [Planococcus antarcticus DSM 14505]
MKNVHFALEKGEIHAGKSTLMKVMSGIYTRDSGTIEVKGEKVNFTSPKQAEKAVIAVIAVDRSAEGGEVVSHIASDNIAGGEMAGEHLVSIVGDGAQVAELEGVPGSSAARERGEGFNNIVADSLDVVAKQTANFNRAEGLLVMGNILQENPDITGVFAHNDEMALGAIEAIEASGKDIAVVGFDASDDAVKAVEEGRLAGTIEQNLK